MNDQDGRDQGQRKVGLLWWTEDQWDDVKEVSEDSDSLDDTFEDWKQNATNVKRTIEDAGVTVEKVHTSVSELVEWCEEQGRPVNGKSRSEFAAKKLRDRDSS